jgi:hypothetical protein
VRVRKKPIEVEAVQWFKNGDHPDDHVGEVAIDLMAPEDRSKDYERLEGRVVRFFRHPDPEYAGELIHEPCGRTWHDHGWIDTLEGGHTACPGDWIITGIAGEKYPCKPDIFDATYEPVTLTDGMPIPGITGDGEEQP